MRLGNLEAGSVAPAVYGLLDRGVLMRPELADGLVCQIELRLHSHPPVRVSFRDGVVLVEDAPEQTPEPEPPGEEGLVADVDLDEADAEPEEPAFNPDANTLERAAAFKPNLVVSGSLPDVVAIMATPLMGGLPRLTDRRGRSALASLASGRVRFRGSPRLMRRLLRLIQI